MMANAQNFQIHAHKNGEVIFNQNTTVVDSIKFSNGNIIFNYNGTSLTKDISQIDSVTFYNMNPGSNPGEPEEPDTIAHMDTTAVDTESGIHITWNNGGEVTIVNGYSDAGLSIEADGENVTVNAATGIDNLTYILDGTATDGNLTITTDKSVVLMMNGVTLHSTTGPALRMVSDKKATLHLVEGTENTISDAENISNTILKGALQAQGKLDIQGEGTLTVNGYTRHGIQSSGKTTILSGTVNVNGNSESGDAMNVDNFVMQDGTLTIHSVGDGLDADQGYIAISGGTISITGTGDERKGLGCDSTVHIAGGSITINMSGLDAKGINSNSHIYLTGGTQTVTVTGNQSKGIKADGAVVISGANCTVNANGTYNVANNDISYCTGIKADGIIQINDGEVNVTCATTNNGGKCLSSASNVTISNGTVTLSAMGNCGTTTVASNTETYSTAGIKSKGSVSINGGSVTMNVTGKGISATGNFNLNGGETHITTSGNGAVTSGSGTSATDGYCSAGVTVDGSININAGKIACISSGKGGRGLKCTGTMNVGAVGANDDLIWVYTQTSGATVNSTTSGGGPGGGSSDYWKGIPTAIKCTGSIHINSGHVSAYAAQTSGDPTGEGIESKDSIIIRGGEIEANAYDDAINCANYLEMTGGKVWAYSRGNDGIDCNGSYTKFTGGTVIAAGTEEAIDANSDGMGGVQGHLQIGGATILVFRASSGGMGGPSMALLDNPTYLNSQKALKPSTLSTTGNCIQNASSANIMVYKHLTVSGSGMQNNWTDTGAKPGPGGGGQQDSANYIFTSPDVTTGTYSFYSSATINGGTSWHGLYTGASCTPSGSATSLTAQ